jgi:hypothetical protein
MTELVAQHAASQAATRHGWFYLCKLVAAAFGVLLCLVVLKFFTEHKFTSSNAGFEAALAQPQLDLLLIGSSHTRKSYDVQMLEQSIGGHSLFLVSYDGLDMISMAQMLDVMAATPGHCPRHIVVEAYGAMFARPFDLQDPRYYADATPSMKIAILHAYVAGRPFTSSFLDVFNLVVNRGNDEIVAFPLYAWAQKIDSYKGGRSGFNFPGMTAEQFSQLKAQYYAAAPNPAQVAALNHVMDLAASHNIALLFVDTPMPGPVSSDPVMQNLRRDYRNLVTARNFPFIDGNQNFPVNDPSLFTDSNHLSSRGRDEFTARIAAPLKAWLAGASAGVAQ